MSAWLTSIALWTVISSTASTPDELEIDALPVSQRETRGAKHPDCEHRVPLWEHVVVEGESLGLIAGRYGVRRADVVALNAQIVDPNHIVPGQRVRVCPELAPRTRTVVRYEVAAGDSLSSIALAHGMSLDELVTMAEKRRPGTIPQDPRLLRVGQVIELEVDGGIVEDFLPPPPRARPPAGGASTKRPRAARVDVQLGASDAVHLKRPHLAFGTKRSIHLIQSSIERYVRRHGTSPKVVIGDMSRRGGGKLSPHVSHQDGMDVDVGYILKGADAGRTHFSGVNRSNLDVGKTWGLIKAFLDSNAVLYIFADYAIQEQLYQYAKKQGTPRDVLDELFQYPRGRGKSHGVIRHWKSHQHHFHVRFR